MPSTTPWSPTFSFNTDPDPQNLINSAALQSQLQFLSGWCADLSAALDVSIRDDNTLTDALVRLRNLHPELALYLESGITGPIITESWSWYFPVRTASTANVVALFDVQVMDGVTLVSSDEVLLKNQTIPSQNGLWVVHAVGDPPPNASGAWTRRSDLPAGLPAGAGWGVIVREGATNAETAWGAVTGGSIAQQPVIGTNPLTFFALWGPFPLPVSRGGTGAGTVDGAITNLGVPRKLTSMIVGDGVQSDFTITHNWNTRDMVYSLREVLTQQSASATLLFPSLDTVTVRFYQAPPLGENIALTIVG